jgi:hypothetical protein
LVVVEVEVTAVVVTSPGFADAGLLAALQPASGFPFLHSHAGAI